MEFIEIIKSHISKFDNISKIRKSDYEDGQYLEVIENYGNIVYYLCIFNPSIKFLQKLRHNKYIIGKDIYEEFIGNDDFFIYCDEFMCLFCKTYEYFCNIFKNFYKYQDENFFKLNDYMNIRYNFSEAMIFKMPNIKKIEQYYNNSEEKKYINTISKKYNICIELENKIKEFIEKDIIVFFKLFQKDFNYNNNTFTYNSEWINDCREFVNWIPILKINKNIIGINYNPDDIHFEKFGVLGMYHTDVSTHIIKKASIKSIIYRYIHSKKKENFIYNYFTEIDKFYIEI